jgi:integrase
MNAGTALPPLRATRLLDQVRERLRYAHYSLSTERSYVYWVRSFVRFHGLRHPREMGAAEVEGFLSWLANRHGASVSTHRQALSALVFLYRQVLGIDLPWLQEIGRPRPPQRLPLVMSRLEVQRLLQATTGPHQLVFRLLYGTGMRKMEALRLRVKDVDFDRGLVVVREGKGNKDRITMLPRPLMAGTSQIGAQLDHRKPAIQGGPAGEILSGSPGAGMADLTRSRTAASTATTSCLVKAEDDARTAATQG